MICPVANECQKRTCPHKMPHENNDTCAIKCFEIEKEKGIVCEKGSLEIKENSGLTDTQIK